MGRGGWIDGLLKSKYAVGQPLDDVTAGYAELHLQFMSDGGEGPPITSPPDEGCELEHSTHWLSSANPGLCHIISRQLSVYPDS